MKNIIRSVCYICLCIPLFGFDRFDEPDNGLDKFLDDGRHNLKVVNEKLVDVPYEKGKSVYYGRGDSPKLSYCIVHEGQKVKVKRSSMYSYKHSTFSQLADQLYNCDDPDSKIISELPRQDFIHLLYYFDVRYKLNLDKV